MSQTTQEPTATEICDMFLKAAGVIALAVVSTGYISKYLSCVPNSTLWSAWGPVTFVAACYLLAGRVVVWNILGPSIATIPAMTIRVFMRTIACTTLACAMANALAVFSPAFDQDASTCPKYTAYDFF